MTDTITAVPDESLDMIVQGFVSVQESYLKNHNHVKIMMSALSPDMQHIKDFTDVVYLSLRGGEVCYGATLMAVYTSALMQSADYIVHSGPVVVPLPDSSSPSIASYLAFANMVSAGSDMGEWMRRVFELGFQESVLVVIDSLHESSDAEHEMCLFLSTVHRDASGKFSGLSEYYSRPGSNSELRTMNASLEAVRNVYQAGYRTWYRPGKNHER